MTEQRTELKENRNSILWVVWFLLALGAGVWFVRFDTRYPDGDIFFCGVLGFTFLTVIYRCLTYGLNQLLLLFLPRKKFKINRLKGRITPIYKLSASEYYDDYSIYKFSAKYAYLNLEWSVPFSVLFQEQEYVCQGRYDFEGKVGEIKSLSELWEEENSKEVHLEDKRNSAEKTLKQQINKLNKEFKENYK